MLILCYSVKRQKYSTKWIKCKRKNQPLSTRIYTSRLHMRLLMCLWRDYPAYYNQGKVFENTMQCCKYICKSDVATRLKTLLSHPIPSFVAFVSWILYNWDRIFLYMKCTTVCEILLEREKITKNWLMVYMFFYVYGL